MLERLLERLLEGKAIVPGKEHAKAAVRAAPGSFVGMESISFLAAVAGLNPKCALRRCAAVG